MLGLIKKDFLVLKSNMKSMLVIFLIYFIMILQGSFDATFVVPLIGIMLFISTFSYDDFNNWNAYAITLPNGRKNVVKAKYIASVILTVILSILAMAISIAVNYMKNNVISLEEILLSLMGTLMSCILIISLLYPAVFKFGSANGRIILFSVVFGASALIAIISNFVDMTFVINAIEMLGNYLLIVLPIIFVLILLLSYLVSCKIYKNKEF